MIGGWQAFGLKRYQKQWDPKENHRLRNHGTAREKEGAIVADREWMLK